MPFNNSKSNLDNFNSLAGDKLVVCTYATKLFRRSAKLSMRISAKKGADFQILASECDIDSRFLNKNKGTFELKRGAGYWLWKPYLLFKISQSLPESCTVLYIDATVVPKLEKNQFCELATDNKIHLWHDGSPFAVNRYWCDASTWKKVRGSSDGYHDFHFWAGAILAQNTNEFKKFLTEWLDYCQVPSLLRPDSFPGYSPEGETIWHRHDQSILNALLQRNISLFTFHFESDEQYSYSDSFFHHRRGYLGTMVEMRLFLIIRKIYRITWKHLPKKFQKRLSFFSEKTKLRNPISINERDRNAAFLSDN